MYKAKLSYLIILCSFSLYGQSPIDQNPGCGSNFFTITIDGLIQKWDLVNGAITGGDTIVTDGGYSLAVCNFNGSPGFISTLHPDDNIIYFDTTSMDWQEVTTPHPLINAGGHGDDLYFMGTSTNNTIYYYDDGNLILLDSFTEEHFAVADIAVDAEGKAWTFFGHWQNLVSEVRVYDPNGFVASYPISFYATSSYGAMILRDTLYFGVGIGTDSPELTPGALHPVIINDSIAVLGDPIVGNENWMNSGFSDLASCYTSDNSTSIASNLFVEELKIFPNPTKGEVTVLMNEQDSNMLLYNGAGQTIEFVLKNNQIDLSNQPNGIYLLFIIRKDKIFTKKIIKQE